MAYAELFGGGFGVTVHGEYAFTNRVGVSIGTGATAGFTAGYPALAHFYSDSGRWEAAGGLLYSSGTTNALLPIGYVGYRRVPQRGGLVFRAGVSIGVFDDGVLPLPGLSLGWAL